MKKIYACLITISMIFLCSCTFQKEEDINEFVNTLSSGEIQSVQAEDFRIKNDGERYRYSYVLKNNIMLCLYADRNGVIVQCTVTAISDNSEFALVCNEVTRTFTGKSIEESTALVKKAFKNPLTSDGYKLTLIDSNVGLTYLINYESDEINTNEYPTLKKYIKKEDVTRPTIGEENSTPKTY